MTVWRWIIRVWVSIVLFFFLMFCFSVLLIRLTHLLAKISFPLLLQWSHAHVLLTLFLLGVSAGQVVLGSNFTGRGWFRSRSGQSYEGFKLEKIKPWSWLLFSPVFMLGVISWCMEQSKSRIFSSSFFINFYRDVLEPNCSLSWWRNYRLYPYCGVQLICIGIWTASIGYSLALWVRSRRSKLWHRVHYANELATPKVESQKSLMKEKTDQR